MELQLLMEYLWVLLILVGLEGLLAADNALILAIMVKHLPEKERKKALFYGLFGAFVLRLASLFLISYLIDIWQVQALGAVYLLYISIKNIYTLKKKDAHVYKKEPKGNGLWMTVVKVEFADLAFAVDSILAAVALAVALPPSGFSNIGGIDGGQFAVIFIGGMLGVIIMRFAANWFVDLLKKRPGLEIAAFIIVGWVGVKLAILVLGHENVGILPETFIHSTLWKSTFYIGLIAIALIGWFSSKEKRVDEKQNEVNKNDT